MMGGQAYGLREAHKMKKKEVLRMSAENAGTGKATRDIVVDTGLRKEERIQDDFRQAGDPYCYRYGDYTVKIAFSDTDISLEERMLAYLRAKCTTPD